MKHPISPSQVRQYKRGSCMVFYRTTDALGMLSNFAMYPCHLETPRLLLKSSEILYQILKFSDHPEIQRQIADCVFPKYAKQVAQTNAAFVRSDWIADKVNLAAMRFTLLAKLISNPSLEKILIQTGDVPLVELSKFDDFWGAKPDGEYLTGVNALGRLWIELRQQIRDGVDLECKADSRLKIFGVVPEIKERG